MMNSPERADGKTVDASFSWDGLVGRDRHAACLVAARSGSREAMDVLVAELTPLVWQVARGNGLDRAEAEAVVERVWLALLRHLERLEEPRALVGWLITTTRRETTRIRIPYRMVEARSTVTNSRQLSGEVQSPETELLRSDRDRRLWVAFRQLSFRCQELLRLTVLAGQADFSVVAEALHMPRGSVGPTRGRCLASLGTLLGEQDEVRAESPIDVSELAFLIREPVPQVVLADNDDGAERPISTGVPVADDAARNTTVRVNWTDRTFPVSIYMGDGSGHGQVETAVEALLRSVGIDVIERDDPIFGSWYRRMRARTQEAACSPVMREAAAVAAHALDSRGVLAHDATVTATMMQNLGPLLTSLQSTKDAVIRVGALLIVKAEWVVAVHQLTSTQQLRLDHQPRLLTSPRDILQALELADDCAPRSMSVGDGAQAPPMPPIEESDYLTNNVAYPHATERPDHRTA